MSINLLKNFSNALRKSLPRLTCKPAHFKSHIRFVTAMEPKSTESHEVVILKRHTRFRKRQWEVSKGENGETQPKKTCEDGEKVPRIKRRKMAMMIGYSGVNYFGMQRNPGVATIEEDLLKALLEAKYISEEDFKNQQLAQFQRSSRTDKGVSAARQVVSLLLPQEVNHEEINKHLPDCIRVFGIKRVTNRFNSKSKCNARTYSYTLPTYVFEPSLETPEQRKHYRITSEKMEKINSLLALYHGTKAYHNFTEKKQPHDPSALRYMMSFTVDKVFVESDMEFAVLLVKGQSFMIHQIRKMVGLVIAVIRGHAEHSIFDRVFSKERVMTPIAPGLGLVLDMVHYDRYDKKFKSSHESLTWDEVEPIVQKFKHDHIYPSIVKGEIDGNSMGQWLEKLQQHSYEPCDDEITFNNSEKCLGDDDDDNIDDENDEDKPEELSDKRPSDQTVVNDTASEVKDLDNSDQVSASKN